MENTVEQPLFEAVSELDQERCKAFARVHYDKYGRGSKQMLILWTVLFFFVIYAVIHYLALKIDSQLPVLFQLVVVLLGTAYFYFSLARGKESVVVNRILANAIWKRTREESRTTHYAFFEDHFVCSDAFSVTKHRYEAILSLGQDGYYILFLSKDLGYVIGKTDFTVGNAAEFIPFIEEKCTGGQKNLCAL